MTTNKNNFLETKKGITLIALVITIIVLLILAGINIGMLSGENSILARAVKAKTIYEDAEFKEQLQMEVLGTSTNSDDIDVTKLKENIEQSIVNSSVINSQFPLYIKNTKTDTAYLIDDDGTVMQYDENAIARIKDKFYKTLQSAINDVPTNNIEKEVILLKDTTENISIKANQNIFLNLNSKTVTGTTSKDYTIATSGNLTIMGNGKVTGTTIGVRSWNNGSLKIIDGIYEGTSASIRKNDTSPSIILNGGTYNARIDVTNNDCTINGGVFNSNNNECVLANGNTKVIINNGQFIGQKRSIRVTANTNLTINGGSFTSIEDRCITCDGSASLKINKGSFNSSMTSDIYSGVIQTGSSGSVIIGNVGDNNNDILINNNQNTKMCGVWTYRVR